MSMKPARDCPTCAEYRERMKGLQVTDYAAYLFTRELYMTHWRREHSGRILWDEVEWPTNGQTYEEMVDKMTQIFANCSTSEIAKLCETALPWSGWEHVKPGALIGGHN